MSLFTSQVHQDIWQESNCPGCWQHNLPCPIFARAIRTNRKPVEWDRNPRRGVLMADTIKCRAKSRTPPPRPVVDVDVPMFDVTPARQEPDHA